jgi:hypothetical protein
LSSVQAFGGVRIEREMDEARGFAGPQRYAKSVERLG